MLIENRACVHNARIILTGQPDKLWCKAAEFSTFHGIGRDARKPAQVPVTEGDEGGAVVRFGKIASCRHVAGYRPATPLWR